MAFWIKRKEEKKELPPVPDSRVVWQDERGYYRIVLRHWRHHLDETDVRSEAVFETMVGHDGMGAQRWEEERYVPETVFTDAITSLAR